MTTIHNFNRVADLLDELAAPAKYDGDGQAGSYEPRHCKRLYGPGHAFPPGCANERTTASYRASQRCLRGQGWRTTTKRPRTNETDRAFLGV